MIEIREHYFKLDCGEQPLMSGLPLPDPGKGPYHFIGCLFHPAVEDTLKKHYSNSQFTDCEGMGFIIS